MNSKHNLLQLVKMTRDSSLNLIDFLPFYREGIQSEDFMIRDFTVDSLLLRAEVANAKEWVDFRAQLQSDEEYFRAISWLGRFFGPWGSIKINQESLENEKRRRMILWLIQEYPESRIHQRPHGKLNNLGDEAAYDIAKSMWFKKMIEFPDKPVILSNAASFFFIKEPSLSKEFYSLCVKLEPNNKKWQKKLESLACCTCPSDVLIPENTASNCQTDEN